MGVRASKVISSPPNSQVAAAPRAIRQGAAGLLAVAGGVHLQGLPAVTQRPEDGVDGVAVPGQIHRDAVVALDIPQRVGQVAQGALASPSG